MSETYMPRPGSFAANAIDHFKANPQARLSTTQLAAMLGTDPKNMSGLMKTALQRGMLAVQREGRHYFYSLGDGLALNDPGTLQTSAIAPKKDQPADGLTIALYNDGELFLSGIEAVEGGVLLNAAKTAQLRQYLLHTGSFIEHLQRGE